jgi:hypothetical protein
MSEPKKNIMRLTVPSSQGYHPQIGGYDPVSDGGKIDDSTDVTYWLLTRLGQIHDQARDLINQHLATLPNNGQKTRQNGRKRAFSG